MIHLRAILSVVMFTTCSQLSAQIVVVTPAFPGPDEAITVTYDATKGNAGLKGTSQVYMHAGLVTNKSQGMEWRYVVGNWGQDDAKVKMNNLGNDKHAITYNIREFHGLPPGEELKYLAFVFRNIDGSKEGKTETNGDIFIPASSGSNSSFIRNAPESTRFIATINSTITLDYTFAADVDITVWQNGLSIFDTTSNSLRYDINVLESGNYTLIVEAATESETILDTLKYTVFEKNRIAEPPVEIKSGVNVVGNKIYMMFEAPDKEYAYLVGNFNNWSPDSTYQMNRTQDGTKWWIEMEKPDLRYLIYKYKLPGNIEIADPYSTLILDENHDPFITNQSFFPSFPSQAYGRATVYDLEATNFSWKYDHVILTPKEKLVIYELLLRDFLKDHSYLSLLDTLSYLKNLGVNAIELMPVSEFEGNLSWGYNPSFHMALDKYYGSSEELKLVIDEAHRLGIAVILDVVYNHAFSQCPLAQMYWNAAENKPASDNPWLNPDAKHPFNVGYDFNHESTFTRHYVKRTLSHWIEEYHVDGFRFDLSKGFTQRFSTHDGTFRQYDQSRINILTDYGQHIWSIDSSSYLILEHFGDNLEEETLSDLGFMLWNNLNHEYINACQGKDSDFSNLSYKNKGWSAPHAIGYMESHDEERISYSVQVAGSQTSGYDTRDFDITIERLKLGALFFYAVPGPRMMWQFGELAYDFSINTCENGTISPNCRLSPKPILWSDFQNEKRRQLFDLYSEIIHLRNKYDLFQTETFFLSSSSRGKVIRLSDEENGEFGIVIGNFDVRPLVITPIFQTKGIWYEYFSGEEKMVNNQLEQITLQPGEYRLYTNFKMDTSSTTPVVNLVDDQNIRIFPNPWSGQLSVNSDIYEIQEVFISDLSGRQIHHESLNHGVNNWTWNTPVDPGFYFIRLTTDKGLTFTKSIVRL